MSRSRRYFVGHSHDTDAEGQWPILIDHDRLVFEEERLEPRTIVKLTRRFQFIVRNGITRFDQDKIF